MNSLVRSHNVGMLFKLVDGDGEPIHLIVLHE